MLKIRSHVIRTKSKIVFIKVFPLNSFNYKVTRKYTPSKTAKLEVDEL